MHCDEIQLDLTAYHQGGLTPERRAAVESHMASCQICAEEAAAVRDIGRLLSRGLKEWVDQGVCPPDVMQRIEHSLRAERKQPWWQHWPTYAGAAAAAVLFLVMFASRSMDLSHQVASLPLVGTLAAQLLYPGTDMRVDDIPDGTSPLAVVEQEGVTLFLYQAGTGPRATQVQYALRGANLLTDQAIHPYEAKLTGAKGDLKVRTVRIQRAEGEVLVIAEYEPVLPGQMLTLTLNQVPLTNGRKGAVWQVQVRP